MRLRAVLTPLCATMLAVVFSGTTAESAPQRIVSLNLCSDDLLLRLVSPSRIASVTWLSREPRSSNVTDLAARVPVNHGLAEEVVPQRPDLVLAGAYTTATATAIVRRQGIPVHVLPIPASIAEARTQIREVAAILGEEARGEAIGGEMDRRLAAIPPAPTRRVSTLVLNPAGFTIGAASLVNDILARAGLDNLAAKPGAPSFVPLEFVVASAPELLIINAERDGPRSLATELLNHPIFARLRGTRTIVLPSRLWTCGGPAAVEAVERLAAVARELRP